MRDALLMVVVAIIAIMAVFAPRYGLMGYLWFAIFRPDILAFSSGRPYSMVLAVVTAASSLRAIPHAMEMMRNPFIWIFLGYQAWTGLSVLMAQNVKLCFPAYNFFLTTSAIVMLIPLLIRSQEHFRMLMQVLAASIGTLGAKIGLYGILAGGAVFVQGYGGYLNDNNLLALAIVMGVPLLWYALLQANYLPLKAFFGFMIFTSLAAIAMCHSRGGILSLACVMVLMAWHSKRRVAAFVFIGLLSLPGAWLVRGTLMERMSTLSNVEEDESAMGRLAFWKAALRVSRDYPIFGVGFGSDNYVAIADSYIEGNFSSSRVVVHNTYFQMLADSGYPTLIIYCALLFGCIFWLKRHSKAIKESNPEAHMWAEALRISLIGFAVGSFFLSRVTYDFQYMLLMAAVTMYQINAMAAGAPAAQLPVPAQGALAPPDSAPGFPIGPLAPDSPGDDPAWKRAGAGRKLRSRQRV
jgi:probable O-glycosylation ligase (exosortase A-associated)